jgi:hypothetical protein
MWDPQHLTTLWASMACYRDNFYIYIYILHFLLFYRGPGGSTLPKDVLNNLTQFQKKQKKGTIDVWWLYDDGGKTHLNNKQGHLLII